MKKTIVMGLVAALVACVGFAIAIISCIQKGKCCCDDCCCDDDLEIYDDYDNSVVEGEISEKSDFEEKDEGFESEKK